MELATAPFAAAGHRDAAAMHLRQRLTKSALFQGRHVCPLFSLLEKLEDPVLRFERHPSAIVRYGNTHHVRRIDNCLQHDVASGGVNFTALESKLEITWASRWESASSSTLPAGNRVTN